MSGLTVPAPGDPTPGQLANADQRRAAVIALVDRLVSDTTAAVIRPGYDPRDLGVWIDVSMNDCVDAAFDMTAEDDDDPSPALAGLLGEAILRLAQRGESG